MIARLPLALMPMLALAGAACDAQAPPRGVEATCAKACEAKVPRCGPTACARGCGFVLDRLVEREGGRLLACLAASDACDDHAWAQCATRLGPHADGGPPAPPPPVDVVDTGGD